LENKVVVSNRHKVFWPDEGLTKGDVIDYYDKMADYILPHLKDRPLSLRRNPNGIRDEGFFTKMQARSSLHTWMCSK
jgi:bifunctional non-homologous end joining protein LigD